MNVEGASANHGCNKGDGTEGITGCIYSHYFKSNTKDKIYEPAVCMKSSTLRSKGLNCRDKSTDFCWYNCVAIPHNAFEVCQCDSEKNVEPVNSKVPIDCYFPKENDCDWYRRCLEARVPCESTKHRYALSYATKYCNLFNENYNNFSNDVRRWIAAVGRCLQQSLVHVLFPQSNATCETLKKTAFYTHTSCYLRPTPSIYMCNLRIFDFLQISSIIKKGFLTDFSDMVNGTGSIFKECILKMFTGNNVARLNLYVKNNIKKMSAGKMADYVSNKMALIQKWSSDVMFLSYSDESFKSKSTPVQVLLATKDGNRAKVEDLISSVKDSAYDGKLTSLELGNGETARIEKIEKSVRPDYLHASFSIDTDHHECAKSGGYCLNNTLQCDKPNDARCEDGARCCILDNEKDLPCINEGGRCQETSIPCDRYESGKCGGNSNRKCCVPLKGTPSCNVTVVKAACKIRNTQKITLIKVNPSGVNDSADPDSNIRDTCYGKEAKRSSYKCDEGQAPGGSTCLDLKILQYIYDLGTSTKYQVQVNAIAGACHTTRSKHYDGKAVDFQLFGKGTDKEAQAKAFMDECTKHGGWSHGGTHVHCQIVESICVQKGGKCQENSIPCDNYQTGLCDGGQSWQCCISNEVADKPCTDKGGTCQQNSVSCSGSYTSGLCGGSASRQCCLSQSGS